MRLTRAISVCALGLAIMLAIGAVTPYQPFASAQQEPIILIATLQPYIVPTPALPTPALAAPVEQPAAAPVEQLAAAPVEQPQAAPVEQQPAVQVEQQPQASIEQQLQAYTYQSEPLRDLSQDSSAAPGCDPGIESPYCTLPIGQPAPAPAPAYQPMTERQQQQSRQRTR